MKPPALHLGYMAALDAGADGLDLSMAPVSGGTCQPDIATMWHALRGTDYDLGMDIDKVLQAEEVFKECMKDYVLPPEAMRVEPMIPLSPMPGGALTTNTQMMRDNDILHRFPEIIAAMGEVVRRGGFGTSVTPVSQFYFQQAFNNVMFGPWKKMADGYGKMVLGYFGRTPSRPTPRSCSWPGRARLAADHREPPADQRRGPERGRPAASRRCGRRASRHGRERVHRGDLRRQGRGVPQGPSPVRVRKGGAPAAKAEAPPAPSAAAAPSPSSDPVGVVRPEPQVFTIQMEGQDFRGRGEAALGAWAAGVNTFFSPPPAW